MDNRTTNFVKSRFHNYYKNAEIDLPDHLPNREWAFIFYDNISEKMMYRHKSFSSPGDVLDYLYGMTPAHVYNSTAYYEYPDARKMNEKNWLGAELIFDLDADHLPNAPKNYSDMMELVKKETFKLMDFILEDFGFSEQETELVFSGGRGYHVHVISPQVLTLGSAERREIVNYVSGKDLDFKYLFRDVAMAGEFGIGSKTFKGIKKVPIKSTLVGYDSGWGKRIALYLTDYMKAECKKKYKKDMFPELRRCEKIGDTTIKKLINVTNSENGLKDILEKGRLDFDVKNFKGIAANFMKESIEDFLKRFGVAIDEPVTADIKRLIRVPGSLHGGSGMLVKKLALSELEKFDSLNDAIVFGERPVKISVSKPFSIQLKGKDLRVIEGTQEVPEYAAIYLICRGVAEYGYRRNQPDPV
jgi:DNA primase small subunit